MIANKYTVPSTCCSLQKQPVEFPTDAAKVLPFDPSILPDDLWEKITGFLPRDRSAGNISLACHSLHRALWQPTGRLQQTRLSRTLNYMAYRPDPLDVHLMLHVETLKHSKVVNLSNANASCEELVAALHVVAEHATACDTLHLSYMGKEKPHFKKLVEDPESSFNRALGELSQLKNLRSLVFQLSRLSEIPVGIRRLTQLRKLDLCHNSLGTLPSWLTTDLRQLEWLSLCSNHLTHVSEDIGQLSRLQLLLLSSNRLNCFPAALKSLPHLIDLDLAGNPGYVPPLRVLPSAGTGESEGTAGLHPMLASLAEAEVPTGLIRLPAYLVEALARRRPPGAPKVLYGRPLSR
jgi:hypothetical protein